MGKSKQGILLLQKKSVLDLFSEAGLLGCININSHMDVNTKLPSLRMLGATGDWWGH